MLTWIPAGDRVTYLICDNMWQQWHSAISKSNNKKQSISLQYEIGSGFTLDRLHAFALAGCGWLTSRRACAKSNASRDMPDTARSKAAASEQAGLLECEAHGRNDRRGRRRQSNVRSHVGEGARWPAGTAKAWQPACDFRANSVNPYNTARAIAVCKVLAA